MNQLPRIAGGAAVLLAGLVFLIAAWRMPKAGLLRCVNGALAALCLCLLPGTLSKILLPGSLLTALRWTPFSMDLPPSRMRFKRWRKCGIRHFLQAEGCSFWVPELR